MFVCTIFRGNPSNICRDRSVWTRVVAEMHHYENTDTWSREGGKSWQVFFFFYDIPASGLEWVQVYQRCESPNPPKEETQLYPTFPRYPGNKDILIFLSCNKTKIKTEPTKRGMCFGGRSTSPCTCKICKLFLLSWETVSCCTSGDRRCFVTFIFLSFFPPRKSLIGLCFCPPLMWSLYTQLKRMYTQACFEEEKN